MAINSSNRKLIVNFRLIYGLFRTMVLVYSNFYSLWWILVVEVNSSDKEKIACAVECIYKD